MVSFTAATFEDYKAALNVSGKPVLLPLIINDRLTSSLHLA